MGFQKKVGVKSSGIWAEQIRPHADHTVCFCESYTIIRTVSRNLSQGVILSVLLDDLQVYPKIWSEGTKSSAAGMLVACMFRFGIGLDVGGHAPERPLRLRSKRKPAFKM
jgi:hypothetical protein